MRVIDAGLVLAWLLAPSVGAAQPAQPDSAEIVYVGNEGFFLSYAGRGVLVDALVRRGVPPYVRAPQVQREALETAAPPFDRVALVLATHDHADHFDPAAVWRHLDHNEYAVFVSTPRAVQRVKVTPSTAAIEERLYGTLPAEGQRAKFAVEGIDLDVLNLHHGRQRDPPVANVGFLIDIEGFRVVHLGDTEVPVEELLDYGLAQESIDVAFVPYWQLMGDDGKRLVEEALNPRYVVAMHIPAGNASASYFEPATSLGDLVNQLREVHPGVIILQDPFDTVKIAAR